MKKKLTYRDKLIELAYIYDVKEIKDYVKSKKTYKIQFKILKGDLTNHPLFVATTPL